MLNGTCTIQPAELIGLLLNQQKNILAKGIMGQKGGSCQGLWESIVHAHIINYKSSY
jgi:hypothetical protein